MTALRAGAASDTGRLRNINQDASLLADPVFAVADGMGGHRAGEVAAQIAVESLRAWAFDRTTDGLVEGVRTANVAVFERASSDPELRGMGTTMCAVALVDGEDGTGDRMAVVNVGDSRAYLFRDGELQQLTRDHTLVQTMVDDERLTPEEAAVHPQRHIVTRALGIDAEVEVDTWEITPFSGDRFLVCSDGLFNEVDDDRISSVLRRLGDPNDAAAELVRMANEGGGRDNITVVLVDVVDDDDRAVAASTALADQPLTTGDREPDLAGFTTPAPRPDDTAVVAAVPLGGPDLDAGGRRRRRRRRERPAPRRVTWRSLLFVVLVLGVLGAAATSVWWYGRNTYFVGFDGDEVAVFRGRPGGFLWFDPTLVRRTGIDRDDVPDSVVGRIDEGVDQGTEEDALDYVANLEEQIDSVGGPRGDGRTTTTEAGGPDVTIETTTTSP